MILSKNHIYILDDEPGVRLSLETVLSSDGYNVKSFASGKDLLHFMDQGTFVAPAAALVDLRLPDMSGVTVMTKIKQRSPETDIVLLTGNPDMSSAVDSVNEGAYAYLLKPYRIEEIKTILNRILEKQRLVRENRDLTEKLQGWNEKLEDEIHRRTIALNESYRKLQRLYDLRTQFISILSHELRTPATALQGFSDTLRSHWQELPKEKIEHYLSILQEESSRMVRLMSEIFEVSRIQDGGLHLQKALTDLSSFMVHWLEEFKTNYPSILFSFVEKSGSVPVWIDPLYFKTALSHILTNAIKYSGGDGGGHRVQVTTEKEGSKITIRIEDDGPGIPIELREKVFEPFFRLMDDVNRKTPGIGLGLTIARGLLNAMDGTVWVEGKKGGERGCSVVLSLPIP